MGEQPDLVCHDVLNYLEFCIRNSVIKMQKLKLGFPNVQEE